MSTLLHQDAVRAIDIHRVKITEAMVAQQYAKNPPRDGEAGRQKCLQDAGQHLNYLSESLALEQPLLFADYLEWARAMLAGRKIPVEDLIFVLEQMCEALHQFLDAPLSDAAVEYVAAGRKRLANAPSEPPTFIVEDQLLASMAREYLAALLAGDRQGASRMVLDAVESGTSVQDIYLHVFQTSQHELGRLWQMSRISVAQEHYCTAATQLIMSQLYPYLFSGVRTGHTMVATCVAGDLHEIGIRMVSDLFELNGWDTFYLGANTPLPSILGAVREQRADVLAVSATITPHLRFVAELIAQIRASSDCGAVKILVGGYPFRVAPEMWRQMGADGCSHDAVGAVELANRLVADGAAT